MVAYRSAGVSARTIDMTGPTGIAPVGIPAGVIGTSQKGPAYIPTTVATAQDFIAVFGRSNSDHFAGPLAISEWLRTQQAGTFLRVLGVGQGARRETSGDNAGRVLGAGFVVGDRQPQESLGGGLGNNPNANLNGIPGRTHFLGAFMSQSLGSSYMTAAGLPDDAVPFIRGVLMAASGVDIRLSSSFGSLASNTPLSTDVAGVNFSGDYVGSTNLNDGRQEFVLLLNGHKGINSQFPNVLTASFDMDAPNYFGKVLNSDPLRMEQAGYVLYADYPIHPALATVTGSGIFLDASVGTGGVGFEPVAFIVTGAIGHNAGAADAPSYENFEDRYRTAKTPWFTSQKFGGSPENLFRIHSLDDGSWANTKIKISIMNIAPGTDANPYGTFDVVVRDFDDHDKNQKVYEAFRGVSLDESSDKFIGKVIGDIHNFFNFDANASAQKIITTGDYETKSLYIRVELADKVIDRSIDSSALPIGFRGMPHLVTSGSTALQAFDDPTIFSVTNPLQGTVQIPVPFRENISLGLAPNQVADKGLFWGVQFSRKTSVSESNGSAVPESAINSFAKYFPDFQTSWMDMIVSDNEGTPDSATMGILDADRFNNNYFTLNNIRVKYNTVTNLVDTLSLTDWAYVRSGSIPTDIVSGTRALETADLKDPTIRQVAKFTVPFQGGFDGTRIFNKDTNILSNQAIAEEMNNPNRGITNGSTVVAYDRAIDILGDASEVDVQLLAMPGIKHPIITDKAVQMTEARFDALFIMDINEYDATNTIISSSTQVPSVRYTVNNFTNRGLNSSFGAAYYPAVELRDSLAGTIRVVPASVAVLGAFGRNDSIAYPWFAPAGFSRGTMPSVNNAAVVLSKTNMDDLQVANINPLVSFAGSEGVVVWGQKTLLATDSALERVNVRRLLIDIRRKVKKVSNRIIFEQARETTLARFADLVRPILKDVQDKNGVSNFLVKIDTSTTTTADLENKIIRGKIYIQPRKALEFISLDFVLANDANFAIAG